MMIFMKWLDHDLALRHFGDWANINNYYSDVIPLLSVAGFFKTPLYCFTHPALECFVTEAPIIFIGYPGGCHADSLIQKKPRLGLFNIYDSRLAIVLFLVVFCCQSDVSGISSSGLIISRLHRSTKENIKRTIHNAFYGITTFFRYTT